MVAPADVNLHERPRATAVPPSFEVNYSTCMRLQPSERRPPKHPPRNATARQKRHVSSADIIKNLAQAPVQEACRKRSNARVKPKSRSDSRNNVDPLRVQKARQTSHQPLAYFACHSAESLLPSRALSYTNLPRQACAMQGDCCWSASFVSSALIRVR